MSDKPTTAATVAATNGATPEPITLEAVKLDSLPPVGRGAGELSAEEKALAAAIAATAVDGNAAQLPTVHADKIAATKVASKMKRLVKSAGVVPEGLTGRARLVTVAANGDQPGGFKVAVYFGKPGTAPKPKAPPAAATA